MKEYRVTDRSSSGYEETKTIQEGDFLSGLVGYLAFLKDCSCVATKIEVREVSEWEEI